MISRHKNWRVFHASQNESTFSSRAKIKVQVREDRKAIERQQYLL